MTMTLSGSGSIAGLVAGGLPDASITAPDLASNAVDSQALALLHATGSAPVYACRAWVNFNGQGTVAIRASGNVSSITDIGTGDYRVNFATSLPDTNYSGFVCASDDGAVTSGRAFGSQLAESWQVATKSTSNVYLDYQGVYVAVFR